MRRGSRPAAPGRAARGAMRIRDRSLLAVASCGLVQSVTWFVLSLLGILVYTCSIDLPDNPDPAALFGTRLAKFYIADESCGGFNRTYASWLTPPEGVLIINCIVIASSSLWLISSILLIWEAVRVAERRRVWLLWSWMAIAAFCCLSDLGTFINFSVDYSNTVSKLRAIQRYGDMLGFDSLDFQSLSFESLGFESMDVETLMGAEVTVMELLTFSGFMMSMAARGYMLWLLNIAAALWMGFRALSGGCRGDDQEERASLKHHFLSSLYNERQDKVDGLSPPWAVQSPVVGTAPRPPPWTSNGAGAAGGKGAGAVAAPSYEIPRPFRLGPPPPGRPRPDPVIGTGAIPEPDYDRDSLSHESPLGALSRSRSPPHAADALRRQPPPLDEMPRRSALKKAPPSRFAGKTVF